MSGVALTDGSTVELDADLVSMGSKYHADYSAPGRALLTLTHSKSPNAAGVGNRINVRDCLPWFFPIDV